MGRTETMAESGVRKGDLVTTPILTTRKDIDRKVGVAQEVPGINTPPPPVRTETEWRRSQRCVRGTR